MKQTRKIKIFLYVVVATLAMSLIHLPAVSAIESCFTSEDVFNSWDDPYRSGDVMISVKATCDMKLYSMDISFTDDDVVDGLVASYSTFWHSGIADYSESDMRIMWNTDESNPQTVDGRPYIDVEAGDSFFGYWYSIPSETQVFKHNMAVTINSTKYEINGETRTVSNLPLDAMVTITPDESKDVLLISGVESQAVSYTGEPVVLAGNLSVEENADSITVDDLDVQYYQINPNTNAKTPIERPTNPGSYAVKYSFNNDHYRAQLIFSFTIKDYAIISTYVEGDEGGTIDAPEYVDYGGNLHVAFIPNDGYELLFAEYNGEDITDLINDNTYDSEGVFENTVDIFAVFRPVYDVTSGDGTEYTIGTKNPLAFIIGKDPSSYTSGTVVIMVDGQSVDLNTDSEVNPEAQTITLQGEFLDTLTLGEHQIEILFFDTNRAGIARANFAVVEASEDEEAAGPIVPNTGKFTSKNDAAGTFGLTTVIAASVITSFICFALTKKLKVHEKNCKK